MDDPYILAHHHGASPSSPDWFNAALSRAPERSLFKSAGAEIELLSWGKRGNPGLLFLHGSLAHADWWSMIAPFFELNWRCAAISFSGMGRSDRRKAGYTVETFAQEARDAIAAAGLDTATVAPVVIGHSMGGLIGLHALAGNSLARGLILIDTGLGFEPVTADGIRARRPQLQAEHRTFSELADGLARFRLVPAQNCSNDYIADFIARRSLIEQHGHWTWHFDPLRMTVPPSGIHPPIDDMRCPMAFVYGDRSALFPPALLTQTVAAMPPRTPFVAIPDSAHHVSIDQPLALVAALRALLARWL